MPAPQLHRREVALKGVEQHVALRAFKLDEDKEMVLTLKGTTAGVMIEIAEINGFSIRNQNDISRPELRCAVRLGIIWEENDVCGVPRPMIEEYFDSGWSANDGLYVEWRAYGDCSSCMEYYPKREGERSLPAIEDDVQGSARLLGQCHGRGHRKNAQFNRPETLSVLQGLVRRQPRKLQGSPFQPFAQGCCVCWGGRRHRCVMRYLDRGKNSFFTRDVARHGVQATAGRPDAE